MRTQSSTKQAVLRLAVTLLTAGLLLAIASCYAPDTSPFETLNDKLDSLTETVIGSQEEANEIVLWQIAVAALIVVAGFALVGGAALGSQARKETQSQHHEDEEQNL